MGHKCQFKSNYSLFNSSSSSWCSLAVLSLLLMNATIKPLFIYVKTSNSIRIKAIIIHGIIMIGVFPESRWGNAVKLTVFSMGVVSAIVVAVVISLLQFWVVPKT